MRAWRIHELGEPEQALRLDDVPAPDPGRGEVRVRIEAVAANFPDVLLCRGLYQVRPDLPFTPGLEVAGRVSAAGDEVDLAEGTRVIVGTNPPRGGFAEEAVVPAHAALPIPDDLPATAAAALLITYHTGWVGLHRRADLQTGETLLVHGGAGGVGSAAIQLGKAAGARVIATAGGPEKTDVCRRLGADLVIDHRAEDFVSAVKEATGGAGADVVYEPVGGEVFDRSRRCVAFEGRIVVVGFASGIIPQAPANHILIKNYSVVGLHWGLYQRRKPEMLHQVHEELLSLYAKGAIDPYVSDVLAFDDVPAAVRRIADRRAIGKVVIAP
ncbi:MAG: NADPH:quinone oxidoreductase family protein [Streptosporangiaceae bacterium]